MDNCKLVQRMNRRIIACRELSSNEQGRIKFEESDVVTKHPQNSPTWDYEKCGFTDLITPKLFTQPQFKEPPTIILLTGRSPFEFTKN